jgi:hypothetical protein
MQEQNKNSACICPEGFYGPRCETLPFIKCFVNITEPAVYDTSKCRNSMPDGENSVQGFDPCFFFDFSSSYIFKYKLACKSINALGLVALEPFSIGYHYKDLITSIPTFESLPVATAPPSISNK